MYDIGDHVAELLLSMSIHTLYIIMYLKQSPVVHRSCHFVILKRHHLHILCYLYSISYLYLYIYCFTVLFTPCSSLHSHALQFVKGRQCMIILANVIQVYVNNLLYVVLQCTTNYDYG